jgi:hypothetical protein
MVHNINQIISHFVCQFTSQNDKVQFDCQVTQDMAKTPCSNWQGGFFMPITFGYFLIRNLVKKTMNCSNEYKRQKKVKFVTL